MDKTTHSLPLICIGRFCLLDVILSRLGCVSLADASAYRSLSAEYFAVFGCHRLTDGKRIEHRTFLKDMCTVNVKCGWGDLKEQNLGHPAKDFARPSSWKGQAVLKLYLYQGAGAGVSIRPSGGSRSLARSCAVEHSAKSNAGLVLSVDAVMTVCLGIVA